VTPHYSFADVSGQSFEAGLSDADWLLLLPKMGSRLVIRRAIEATIARDTLLSAPTLVSSALTSCVAQPSHGDMMPEMVRSACLACSDGLGAHSVLERTCKLFSNSSGAGAMLSPALSTSAAPHAAPPPSPPPVAFPSSPLRASSNALFWREVAATAEWGAMLRHLRPKQIEMLKEIVTGHDLLLKVATNTGKTYLLTLLAVAAANSAPGSPLKSVLVLITSPFVHTCEKLFESLPPAFRTSFVSRGWGPRSDFDFHNIFRGGSLLICTTDALGNRVLELQKLQTDRYVLLCIDEIDEAVLASGFRPLAPIVSSAQLLSQQLLCMTGTGSPATMAVVRAEFGLLLREVKLGPLGLLARPDVRLEVIVFSPEGSAITKLRQQLIVNILKTHRLLRDQSVVFCRRMFDGPNVHPEILSLQALIEASGLKCVLMHGSMTLPQRDHAMAIWNQGGCAMLATEIVSRSRFDCLPLMVIPTLPTSTEQLVQLIGRPYRSPTDQQRSNLQFGLVVMFERRRDHVKLFDRLLRISGNGEAKTAAMKVVIGSVFCELSQG
jgi:hypothetical protein